MPTISSFYGIFIRMYLRDHPPPHFHAVYQGHEAFVAIESGEVIDGRLPPTAVAWCENGRWRTETNSWIIGDARGPASGSSAFRDWTMIKVVGIEHVRAHELRIRFSDGSFGEHDFSALVNEPGPMLEPLRDATYFARAFLDFGAPTWPNGFDIAPEWLRREMAAAGELRRDAA